MFFRRSIRTLQAAALCAGLIAVAEPASAATMAVAACPPQWLGTTSSTSGQISANGRYVVFMEKGPDGEVSDYAILLRDTVLDTTVMLSDPDTPAANLNPSISADGRRISWLSRDDDLGTNQGTLWVYDRRTGERTAEGVANISDAPQLDAHGKHLVYGLLDDSADYRQTYVRNVDTDTVTLVSATPEGDAGNHISVEPQISASGRFVVFRSEATDLTEDSSDVGSNMALFIRDLKTDTTTLIPDRDGESSSVYRYGARLSPDGRYVLWQESDSVWRYDRRTGETVAAADQRASIGGDISAKGAEVLLRTDSLIVRTVATGAEVVVDAAPDGTVGSGGYAGAITPDGEHVVFYSSDGDLDPDETASGGPNVYVHDLTTGATELVSTTEAGGSC